MRDRKLASGDEKSAPDGPGFAAGIDRLSEVVGWVVAWFTLAMVLITAGIVIARYGFSAGSVAVQEAVIYLHAMVFMLGAAVTLKRDEHVRVDIFYRKLSPSARHLVNLLGVLLLLWPACGYILWTSLDYVGASWAANQGAGEGSREAGGLPYVYLLKTVIPVAMGLLMLQGLALAARSFVGLRHAKSNP
ncbi:MAG: TRAP transporter small permease subunit [Pseudomonadota bacterium]